MLASGEGTNFEALYDACATGYADAEIAVVLCNRRGAKVLERADRAGVEGVFIDPKQAASREEYDRVLQTHLEMYGVDLVCGAGFMRILSAPFVESYRDRILNVHPSLLPAFPGLDAIEQAWEWGVKVTGATVHIIDTELDHGPILFQHAVEVRPDDTLATLTERVHLAEYTIYPKALRFWGSQGGVQISGRRVIVDEEVPDPPWSPGLPPALQGG